jgi:large subunit ribosomal protein L29
MKATEIRELSTEDIKQRVQEEKKQLSKMKFNHSISPVEDTSLFKKTRKTIARLLTELNARKRQEAAK